jgi:hypothetical protein
MKFTTLRISALALALLVACAMDAQSLVHYWNFNNSENLETLLSPSTSMVSGAAINQIAGGVSDIQITSNSGQDFDIQNLNARNGDEAGSHLRFNDPIGGTLQWLLPSTGYEGAVINYVTRRSGSGAGLQFIAYTLDGFTFQAFDTIAVIETPSLVSLDFSTLEGVNDNPNFALQISFEQGAGSDGGNNRFDNVSMDAEAIPVLALLHYWNFNNSESTESLLNTSYTEVGGGIVAQLEGGVSEIQLTSNTGQDFDVQNLNARFGDEASSHLRFNSPIGGGLRFNVPSSGHESIVVNYVTRRSGSGAGLQYVSISTDGLNFFPLDTVAVTETPSLVTLILDSIEAANDNPHLAFSLAFAIGSGGDGGNNRFDNVSAEGFSIAGLDTAAPVATLNPSDNAENVAINTMPTIAFNEPVQLATGEAVTPDNIAAAVELRLDNEAGSSVNFSASYADNTITIVPEGGLINTQIYYLALLPNSISDLSNNVLEDLLSAVFTTIAVQTEFAPGDFAVVAYRMNTTDIDDEFAFVTFVDILPSTLVRITDAKYTSNVPAQCAGGLVWTAPAEGVSANTVITIGNDAGIADIGSVSGPGFGLSSGGDQIMMYTGEPATASHVAALSANAWIENASSCSGSLSQLPTLLVEGNSAISLSTAPDAVNGNLVNGYYNGPQDLTPDALRAAILNPANWVGTDSGTLGQQWPLWAFGSAPAVVSAAVLNQQSIEVTFNRALNEASATELANYSGIDNLQSAELSAIDGTLRKVVLTYSTAFPIDTELILAIANVISAEGEAMEAPFIFSFTYSTTLAFTTDFISVSEDAGFATIILSLSNPSASSVDVVVKGQPWSTAGNSDFSFMNTTLQFDGLSANVVEIQIPITDDNEDEQDEYIAIYLENGQGLSIDGPRFTTVFIRDNDRQTPQPSGSIALEHVTSFNPAGEMASTVEVIAHDPASQRIFATSAIENRFDIVDFSNPLSLQTIASVDMTPYGGITGIATKNGIVAVASPNADEQQDGSVVFFDIDGNYLNQVGAGALPDMIVFSPDGSKVLTANEGQPNNAYTIDPEGSVTVIDLSNGVEQLTQNDASTLFFTDFNADEAALTAIGVRKTFAASTLSQDLEPEYITISPDGATAWIACQENNALAVLDLNSMQYTHLLPLGTKDYSSFGNGFDASDKGGVIHLSNWPVKGYLIPDAIANYAVNGVRYIVTANEGDEKEYGDFEERATINSSEIVLDSAAFPHADFLRAETNLGRFRITNLNGDTDGDGDFDELYAVGARSFSILNAETMEMVYDSGDDFERITANDPVFGAIFNSSNSSNSFKNRSRAKGPEPEGLSLATIKGRTYAFVALERIGGVMVYDITDPANVSYVDYKNTRTVDGSNEGGDLGPEYVLYVAPGESPDGKAYVLISNEVSGTIVVFEVLGASPDPCKYFLSSENAQGGCDIYALELNEDNATASPSLLVSTTQPVSIAYNESNELLYLIAENAPTFRTLNPVNSQLGLQISVGIGFNGFSGATFNHEGHLLVASEDNQAVYRYNPQTGVGSYFSAAQFGGGDIAVSQDGEVLLVSNNPSRAGIVVENGPNISLGQIFPGASGIAARSNGTFFVGFSGRSSLIVASMNEGDTGERFDLLLDGEKFTISSGDLASGCPTAALSAVMLHATPETAVEHESEVSIQPNPSIGLAAVSFEPTESGRVQIEVYDIHGKLLASLFEGEVSVGGSYRFDFDGSALPNGVYILRLTSKGEVSTEKLLIAR